ncbi:hypothetical protein KKG45_09030 [bacterium]|nr:hypothetical protein [bacterium]MBU1073378.1 hypothetical protein [bacterium]MBU1674618.1 hypothetical protein [bacterium]
MGHKPHAPVHTFHIPVMGTGFTIDTPLKVARYGIASVVSLVDDVLIEQVRQRLCREHGEPCDPIEDHADDARARRITAYLDLLDTLVHRQIERVRGAVFEAGSEIVRYFELLPPSPLRALYESMQATVDPEVSRQLQDRLRGFVQPGPIDVNIMTKLDRDHDRRGHKFRERCSDALSALRGFMNSRVDASVVLSAGMNRRLFSYMAEFGDMFPDKHGDLRKRIVLKVSDYRSALLQGKLLAKLGLYVSEFRVESGLNCGGHAFGGKGQLVGPILEEFKREKDNLAESLLGLRRQALAALGRGETSGEPAPVRVTVQGGLGDADEDRLLREHYRVDGTGWGSAFLFVPEVVNIDPENLARLTAAGEDDIDLSGASPLGVPFWSLRTSTSEENRLRRLADGKPGSWCPKGYLVSDSEFTTAPICTASRGFQHRKLEQIADSSLSDLDKRRARESVVAKACICHDLAGGATGPMDIDPTATTAVCCGPNAAYFHQVTTLDGMIDHIYGRASLPLAPDRPHMLLKELSLHLECLSRDIARQIEDPSDRLARTIAECRDNLQRGVQHYRELAGKLVAPHREVFVKQLECLQRELAELVPARVAAG